MLEDVGCDDGIETARELGGAEVHVFHARVDDAVDALFRFRRRGAAGLDAHHARAGKLFLQRGAERAAGAAEVEEALRSAVDEADEAGVHVPEVVPGILVLDVEAGAPRRERRGRFLRIGLRHGRSLPQIVMPRSAPR